MKKTKRADRKQPLKMADLARLAGVSKSTVSRALSGSELINPETRDRIQALAKEHKYRLDTRARHFRLKQKLNIAVIIPSADEAKWQLSDPFFLELIGGIAVSLNEKGHDLHLSVANSNQSADLAARVHDMGCDGVIVIGQWRIHAQLKALAESFPSLVVWGADLPDCNYCTVGGDNYRGGYLAAQHLIEIGRRNIAFIGDWTVPEGGMRFQGYLDALRDAGLKRNKLLEAQTGLNKRAGYQATVALLARGIGFDALFSVSDAFAMGAICALNEHGISVPDDVAVVGYDDLLLASYYMPSLSTIHQDREIGGRIMVERLIHIIEGQDVESFMLPTNLVVRDSSGTLK